MQQQLTYVSALAWVSRGFAKPVPKQLQMTQQQANQMRNIPSVKKNINRNIEDLNKLDMQFEEEQGGQYPVFTPQAGRDMYEEEQIGGQYPFGFEDLSDDEKEDYLIKPEDILIVAGKIEKEFSSLEIYIYQQQKNNLFVHHELMLSAFPLSIEWLNVNLGSFQGNQAQKGNYAIVSTFLTEIDIWDLDLENAVEPEITLGGELGSSNNKPKKFKNKMKKYKKGSHTDSVLSLSLNPFHKHILASGSADQTFKIWDLSKSQSLYTSNSLPSAVTHIDWSPSQNSIILTSSQDNIIRIFDSRFQDTPPVSHQLPNFGQLESLAWNPNNKHQIIYCTDSGYLALFDARKQNDYIFHFQASEQSLTDVKIGSKNMAATCGEDGIVNIYDVDIKDEKNRPVRVGGTGGKSGKLFCLEFYEGGEIICCGNSMGSLFVWDTYENQKIAGHFGGK